MTVTDKGLELMATMFERRDDAAAVRGPLRGEGRALEAGDSRRREKARVRGSAGGASGSRPKASAARTYAISTCSCSMRRRWSDRGEGSLNRLLHRDIFPGARLASADPARARVDEAARGQASAERPGGTAGVLVRTHQRR